MAAEETTAANHDLDEDLFNFDEIAAGDALADEGDADLDEIFASFQAELASEEAKKEPAPAPKKGPAARREPARATYTSASAAPPAPLPTAPPVAPTAPAGASPSPPAAVGVPVQFVTAPAGPGPGLPRTLLWLFVAVTSINALLAIATLAIAGSMSSGVEKLTSKVSADIGQFADQAADELDTLQGQRMPIAAPDPTHHEAFDTAAAMIDEGRFSDARRLLYALLSVVDRMDPAVRDKVEARANYLIAEARHREAQGRIGGRR